MTPTDPTRLTVRSTADLISAVPYLLGFHPTNSVVVIAMREQQLVFVARGDLARPPGGSDQPADVAGHDDPSYPTHIAQYLVNVVGRQATDATTVIGYGPAERVTPVIDAVREAFDRGGLRLLDALRVTDGRYWSYLCDNPECCPPEGTIVDQTANPLAVEATLAGQVALPNRAALAQRVAPLDGPAREAMNRATAEAEVRLAELLTSAPSSDLLGARTLRRAGSVAVDSALDRYHTGGQLTDDEISWLGLLLTHIPVRDDAWERTDGTEQDLALWTDVLRRVEPALAAAPACLLAFAAWRAGQGSLAAVALDRAVAAEPDYSMARLLADVLRHGLPPSSLDGWPAFDTPDDALPSAPHTAADPPGPSDPPDTSASRPDSGFPGPSGLPGPQDLPGTQGSRPNSATPGNSSCARPAFGFPDGPGSRRPTRVPSAPTPRRTPGAGRAPNTRRAPNADRTRNARRAPGSSRRRSDR